jgi:SAM-dependent methyltransferase
MKRAFLFALYQTPRGKLLQAMESRYLKQSITVSCKQHQLQIGGLGWEDSFVDCSLYQNYAILDGKHLGCSGALKICAKAFNLPVQTESMDLVIMPHLLEFDAQRFQTLREIDRVLKPGGELIILNFNPVSTAVRLQCLWDRKLANSWNTHFISRTRVSDWLKLMNFEILSTAEFGVDTFQVRSEAFAFGSTTFLSIAYAVKAVKRCYTLIPLTEVAEQKAHLATAGFRVDSSINQSSHD